ncbi:MAG: VTT domain-containing protein [Alphaproteobacteria bacterium]|nr:VTT domain-containing protein [Alphaproteobacteria bacterium]
MKLQHYLLKKSDSTWAVWAVFFLTVCESIFLFVPPEVFMTPPIVANKKKAVPVVAAAALGSLIGGAIAYFIGFWVFESIGQWIITTFASAEKFEVAKEMFTRHGVLIIVLAAFTPVPYKLVAMAAGFLTFNPVLFIGVSAAFCSLSPIPLHTVVSADFEGGFWWWFLGFFGELV